jgi:hypothetical protein
LTTAAFFDISLIKYIDKSGTAMSVYRISFIEAGAPGLHIFSKFPVPRVGTVLLSTILKEKDYEVKAFITLLIPIYQSTHESNVGCVNTSGTIDWLVAIKQLTENLVKDCR